MEYKIETIPAHKNLFRAKVDHNPIKMPKASSTSSRTSLESSPHPITATRRPTPGSPRASSTTEAAPAYDSVINPQTVAPGPLGQTMMFRRLRLENQHRLEGLMASDSKIVNTRDDGDRTPLYCAVVAYKSNINIVRCLLEGGANVNDWSRELLPPQKKRKGWPPRPPPHPASPNNKGWHKTQRTPLMAACQRNHLPIARLLLEPPYNADPGLVAEDGQHALRLASTSGSREIVKLLPSLRAGGWKRLKYRSKPHIAKIKKTAQVVYETCKFIVFDVPKFVVCKLPYAVYVVGKYFARLLWSCAKEIGSWAVKLPVRIYKLLISIPGVIWRGVKAAPGVLKTFFMSTLPRIIKALFEVSRDIVVAIGKCSWFFTKWLLKTIFIRIPELIFEGFVAIFNQIKNLGKWLLDLLASFASLLHTFFEWIVRNCTWQNVMEGLKLTLKFFFVDIPVGLWNAMRMVYSGLEHLLEGIFGCFSCLFLAIIKMILWFPKKLKNIVVSFGKIFAGAWKEFRVLIDPKANV
ncbi:uncharacterized protein LAJ45_04061 [Morchella importuna]|uniref:uncharacterized protein n=1 Tax=Morchella importuna TaxID=1174673 RepID=UPI001E8EE6F2|nr:uncharacterized protein LAJ45_04061 [Morchella importuna]KAH8152067.1 hypothetical protein LAJ45_04061 [Morchella importuna]